MRSSYSTTDLARMLEVNESTVKRWADSGHIECIRTKGGHRRFPVSSVLKFAQENKLSLPSFDSNVLADIDVHAHVVAGNIGRLGPDLKKEALAGNTDGVLRILRIGLAARPDILHLCNDLIFPPLVEIGAAWAEGTLTVDQEHLASHTLKDAIVRIQSEVHMKPKRDRALVAACAEDDLHDIALRCSAIYFESEGWRVVFLGQRTPADSLVHAINEHHPHLVIVSSVVSEDERRLVRNLNEKILPAVRGVHAKLDIGGANVRVRFGKRVAADSFTENILDYEPMANV